MWDHEKDPPPKLGNSPAPQMDVPTHHSRVSVQALWSLFTDVGFVKTYFPVSVIEFRFLDNDGVDDASKHAR